MVKQIILHRTVQTLHGRMKCLCTVLICLMLSAPSFAHPTESALFILVPSRIQEITYYNSLDRASVLTEGYKTAAFTYNNAGDMVKMQESNNGYTVLTRYYFGNQYELDSTSAGIKERLYLGGDAYSAPMVLQRVNNGSWTAYNIGRDYLGSITHIASASGTLVAEYSYDPWGSLRSPSTLGIYTPGSEPELFLGRGYTGHEHLTWFGLINMNARLYDPLLGRFLSPDPYVQAPDFTQNFNRYSYALNNPLKYTDLSGEVFGADDALIIGAIVGAIIGAYSGGVIANEGEYNPSKWKGTQTLGYMIAGAAFGGMSGYLGSWIAASGIPFANTLSVMASSLFNSFGTWVYTEGQTPILMSFGFSSYDFTNDTWHYLWKKGNKWYENLGYGFGALANITDIFSYLWGGGTTINANSAAIKELDEHGKQLDWWGHYSLTGQNGDTLVSVGPGQHQVHKGYTFAETFYDSVQEANKAWPSYYGEPGTWTIPLNNVSEAAIEHYMSSVSRWDLLINSCVGHSTRALWRAGIPTLYLFHPHMLNAQLFVRQIGIYSSPFLCQIP